mmetsp:Transcript_70520/g.131904  ORF Transcript_70520/g.131904 Transcript_70520/m.131904 type:complete len:366 (-) Transcript_70520:145-1242(-)
MGEKAAHFLQASRLEQLLQRHPAEDPQDGLYRVPGAADARPAFKAHAAPAEASDASQLQQIVHQHEQRIFELEQMLAAHRHECRARMSLMDAALCRLLTSTDASTPASSSNNNVGQLPEDAATKERLALVELCVLELGRSLEAYGTPRPGQPKQQQSDARMSPKVGPPPPQFERRTTVPSLQSQTPAAKSKDSRQQPQQSPGSRPHSLGPAEVRDRSPAGKPFGLVARLQSQQPSPGPAQRMRTTEDPEASLDLTSTINSVLRQPLLSPVAMDDRKVRGSAAVPPGSQMSTRVPSPRFAGSTSKGTAVQGSSSTSLLSRSSSEACTLAPSQPDPCRFLAAGSSLHAGSPPPRSAAHLNTPSHVGW